MEKDINESFNFIVEDILKTLEIKDIEAKDYSSLSLALIGDAVYDLIIRYYVMSFGDRDVNKLHQLKSQIVKAKAQAISIDGILDKLTDTEVQVYKRGRNAKSHTIPKNANVNDYRKSTGFEALLGYLFLKKDISRLIELIKMSLEVING